jgi:hypothetical protein
MGIHMLQPLGCRFHKSLLMLMLMLMLHRLLLNLG